MRCIPKTKSSAVTGRNALNAILWGGLIAGVLDATDGVVAYGFRGLNPIQVLQYIASGVLGPSSFKGGLATAGLPLEALRSVADFSAYLAMANPPPAPKEPIGFLRNRR